MSLEGTRLGLAEVKLWGHFWRCSESCSIDWKWIRNLYARKSTQNDHFTPIPPPPPPQQNPNICICFVLSYHAKQPQPHPPSVPEQVVVWSVHVRRVEQLGCVLLHGQHPASLLHFRRQVSSNSAAAYLMLQFGYTLRSLDMHKLLKIVKRCEWDTLNV